jgi:hypothetical protein
VWKCRNLFTPLKVQKGKTGKLVWSSSLTDSTFNIQHSIFTFKL